MVNDFAMNGRVLETHQPLPEAEPEKRVSAKLWLLIVMSTSRL
jgi:hypothetical protein